MSSQPFWDMYIVFSVSSLTDKADTATENEQTVQNTDLHILLGLLPGTAQVTGLAGRTSDDMTLHSKRRG